MRDGPPTRIDIDLDAEHAAKLYAIAERTSAKAATVAGSLLSTALDQADPDAATISELLDRIPGAWERAQQGLADTKAGRVVALDQL